MMITSNYMPRIVSVGPPPERYADRVVAEMLRQIAAIRGRLWTDIEKIMDRRSDGNSRGQQKMVERLNQIDGADMFLAFMLKPGKRGRYELDIFDVRGWDPYRQAPLGTDDPIPDKPWLALVLTCITGLGGHHYDTKAFLLLLVSHHALSRLVQRRAAKNAVDLLAAAHAMFGACVETFIEQKVQMRDGFQLKFSLPLEMGGSAVAVLRECDQGSLVTTILLPGEPQ
jgi:hypothetical protein